MQVNVNLLFLFRNCPLWRGSVCYFLWLLFVYPAPIPFRSRLLCRLTDDYSRLCLDPGLLPAAVPVPGTPTGISESQLAEHPQITLYCLLRPAGVTLSEEYAPAISAANPASECHNQPITWTKSYLGDQLIRAQLIRAQATRAGRQQLRRKQNLREGKVRTAAR